MRCIHKLYSSVYYRLRSIDNDFSRIWSSILSLCEENLIFVSFSFNYFPEFTNLFQLQVFTFFSHHLRMIFLCRVSCVDIPPFPLQTIQSLMKDILTNLTIDNLSLDNFSPATSSSNEGETSHSEDNNKNKIRMLFT